MSGIIIDFHGRGSGRQARLAQQLARIAALLDETLEERLEHRRAQAFSALAPAMR